MRFLVAVVVCAFVPLGGQQTPTDEKKLCRLEGRTVNSVTGEAVRKVKLELRKRVQDSSASWSATSDAEGKFAFEKVEPGTYLLGAEKTGYLQLTYGATSMRSGGTPLTLAPGQQMKDLQFKLIPQGVITGKVLDEDGEPVSGGTQITVLQQRGRGGKPEFIAGESANDLGEFRLANLSPGRYFVCAQTWSYGREVPAKDEPEEGFVPTFYPGVTDQAGASAVEVRAGQEASGINITLRRARVYRVAGKLAGLASGQSTRNMNIILTPRNRGGTTMFFGGSSGRVKPDGTFDIGHVRPGSYLLSAMVRADMMPQTIGRMPVEVGDSNVKDLVVTLFEPLRISGSVRVEGDGKASPDGMRVMMLQADQEPVWSRPGMVGPDGAFKIDGIAPDKYFLNAFSLPEGTYLKSARAGKQEVLDEGLDLTEAQGAVSLELTLGTKPGAVEGMVREDTKPVPGSYVELRPDPPRPAARYLRKSGSADQNGHFTIKDVAPGKYSAYAWRENPGFDFLQDAEALKEVEGKAVKVTVEEGRSAAADLTPLPN